MATKIGVKSKIKIGKMINKRQKQKNPFHKDHSIGISIGSNLRSKAEEETGRKEKRTNKHI